MILIYRNLWELSIYQFCFLVVFVSVVIEKIKPLNFDDGAKMLGFIYQHSNDEEHRKEKATGTKICVYETEKILSFGLVLFA